MLGFLAVLVLALAVFWLDPILKTVAPSLMPDASARRWSARPPVNESLFALENDDPADLVCPPDAYSVRVFSKAPLVLYVENFLSLEERQHLLEISKPLYQPSMITHNGQSMQRNVAVRDSEVAIVPRTRVVRCLEARARSLQGWRDDLWIELLRVQRYVAPTGHYGFHYDWGHSGAATGGWGRVSSLMIFVDDGALDGADAGGTPAPPSLVGGGTYFPRLPRRSSDARWCRFIGCGDVDPIVYAEDEAGPLDQERADNSTGVVFKPLAGNAVLWENFRPDGTGYEETWHAGLRVLGGVKIGLNIWSWGRMD